MTSPAPTSTTRLLAASLGVAALLAGLLWSLGAGLDFASGLFRSLLAAFIMYLLGLVLGKALSDTLKPEAPTPLPGKKEQKDKTGP